MLVTLGKDYIMKYVLLTAAAVCLLSTPAQARDDPAAQIVIKASTPSSLDRWRNSLAWKLSTAVIYPKAYPEWRGHDGTVSVNFTCDDSGRPVVAGLAGSSGNAALDRAALRAVNTVRGIGPLPAQVPAGAMVRANFIFAADEDSLHRQQIALVQREASLAAADRLTGRQVVVLDIRNRTPG